MCACLLEAGATKALCGGGGDFGIDFGVFLLAEAFEIAEGPTFAEENRQTGKGAGGKRHEPENHGRRDGCFLRDSV